MTTSTFKSVNLLPTYFQTDKNSKFLSSTIDQLIQPAKIERLNAFVGSTATPNYSSSDSYVVEPEISRQLYQLDPALVINNIQDSIQSIITLKDLSNEIGIKGGYNNNFDRLFRSEMYPYDPPIDLDKFNNYQNYFWLPSGPFIIDIDEDDLDVAKFIVGNTTTTVMVHGNSVQLLNGMLVTFTGLNVAYEYQYKEFFVEGVGTSIVLVPLNELITPEKIAQSNDELYDSTKYDFLGFDSSENFPLNPEYVTINRASKDRNPWSRYNRWVSLDVIKTSSLLNSKEIITPISNRAVRPIIEFKADIQLYNFGSNAIQHVDLIDTTRTDAYNEIEGLILPTPTSTKSNILIDGVNIEYGHRIIFAADKNELIRNTVFVVLLVNLGGNPNPSVALIPLSEYSQTTLTEGTSILVKRGVVNGGTSWWFDGLYWNYAQQHTKLNEGPLIDLFDSSGVSYSNKNVYLNNFKGNKIIGFGINENNPIDPVLGLRLNYLNNDVNSSILFENYYANEVINLIDIGENVSKIKTSQTFFKIDGKLANVWGNLINPPVGLNTSTGYYDLPMGVTNNPLNEDLDNLVHGDLDNQKTNNIQVVSNVNPISFAMMFMGKSEHNIVDAITKCSADYEYFKLSLINNTSLVTHPNDPIKSLDEILNKINAGKTIKSSFYLSDMLGYGTEKIETQYVVSDPRFTSYPLPQDFSITSPSSKSLLVYINGSQSVLGIDYEIQSTDSYIEILKNLFIGDEVLIVLYPDTKRNYIPPTPTKLGLYPKFVPKIYLDTSYTTPVNVIQGHDGSITVAFNDYRDDIILEYELRVYNNIKVDYQPELFDIHEVDPGVWRDTAKISDYNYEEINSILEKDFIKWAINYGIDYTTNNSYSASNKFTWKFKSKINSIEGSWRAIFKYYYDTDKPSTSPWEMLGFHEKPNWWDSQYGLAPYTSGNTLMWNDLANGRVAITDNGPVINEFYARPSLSNNLPVNGIGDLLDPITIGIAESLENFSWSVGEQGPAETAWRRSSSWPFAVQKLLLLTRPAKYASLMYDPCQIKKNIVGQWVSVKDQSFLKLKNLYIHGENEIPTNSGYSVYLSENGQRLDKNYISKLRNDLTYANFNLFYPVAGFINKDTIQIFIDAYEPTTSLPGALLPDADYNLILKTSNPIMSIGISGIIIQRVDNNFVVRGYDRENPYFTYYLPIRNSSTPSITVGGINKEFVNWESGLTGAVGNLNLTTAQSAPTGNFYQKDQIVQNGGAYYQTLVSHQSGLVFDKSLFSKLPSLPVIGGATVQLANNFESTPLKIPYGHTFTNIQDLYDLIVGYGKWLSDQGFVFNQFNSDLMETVDWNLSAKEFLYWSTQNWINDSVLSLSPFADQITYSFDKLVVDNIFNKFYEYSVIKSDGTPFEKSNLFITRLDGVFTVKAINTEDGIYFLRLNAVQKEQGIVFNNKTIFGDVVYNPKTSQRQNRVKLVGFRTSDWNGNFSAPGFVYDIVNVVDWVPNTNYLASTVVRYNNFYYSAIRNVSKSATFDFNKWKKLGKKPISKLLPNFDYKINQFKDFYSLDIDNFDIGQEKSAQNLIGYWARTYLNNIIPNPISQYKFYQGFIKEKGTKNVVSKLSNADPVNSDIEIKIYENWALRVGEYGGFTSSQEFEFALIEGTFSENPQIISFLPQPATLNYSSIYYVDPSKFTIPSTGKIPEIKTTTSTNVFKLIHAGYVRIDDVDATAYNQDSLLDIANSNNLLEGNTIWLGFKPDGSWDVLEYRLLTQIVDAVSDTSYDRITITTLTPHKLEIGKIVSISGVSNSLNGVYLVDSIISLTQFEILNSTMFTNMESLTLPGFLFTFESLRFLDFDSIPSDEILHTYKTGSYVWVDSGNDTSNKGWAVYKKSSNYKNNIFIGKHSNSPQGYGYSISSRNGSDILAVGAPLFNDTSNSSGAVVVYKNKKSVLEEVAFYTMPNTAGNSNKLGTTVVYDDYPFSTGIEKFGLTFAGAPGAYNNSGTVLILSINDIYQTTVTGRLTNPNASSTGTYGASIFVQRNTTTKLVLVGAPIINKVYSYIVTATNSSSTVQISQYSTVTSSASLSSDAQWGYSIVGSDNSNCLAISAPYNGYKNTGTVTVIFGNGSKQTISSPFGENGHFGLAMAMSFDASYLAISAPSTPNSNNSFGAVAIYSNTWTNNFYTLTQILTNIVPDGKMYFGMAISINTMSNGLVVSALGTNTTVITTFDTITTFDYDTTIFTESEDFSGTTYLYNRKNSRFVYSQEVNELEESITTSTNFGNSVIIDDDLIFVGAPSTINQSTGSLYIFSKINTQVDGWERFRVQDELLLPESLKQIRLIDTNSDSIISYYDYVDPLKGKILGVAEKEITYKTASDPAIYSLGFDGVNVDTNLNWIDQQVGQLWWDLSNAKFIWYEQGELEYRKNNWGKLFPGASIDVYEWVGSSLLPSEWSVQADTPTGLANGISGQPKYVNNSVLSVKQVYDNVTGNFSNVYFYWVKNKVIVPNVNNRKLSAFAISSYIANPTQAGIQYSSFISSSSLILSNFSTKLRSDEISLNFTIDNTNNKTVKHVEWQLIIENSKDSPIPKLLEKKFIDSLIGNDELGNLVPDPSLSKRLKYGLGIRPQQTLFEDRLTALRNVIGFANNVLINYQITGNYSFGNLNTQEELPQPTTSSWVVIEDISELSIVDTSIVNKASVISDSYVNGGWTVYQYENSKWNRVRTQAYNTTLYWEYVDWISAKYNKYTPILYVIDDPYELSKLNLIPGQYVKINNRGDGNYIIVTMVPIGSIGNFGDKFDVVYSENGTIQFKDSLWNLSFGWDNDYAFNQPLFDQTPNIEISYILSALKNDLFINDLSDMWNSLFFIGVKYALSEQTFIDWAFKTSLVDIVKYAGTLTQTSVYKLQDSAYYENFINEVKPYHTQIRRFTANFENFDDSMTRVIDFDEPFVYDQTTQKFVPSIIPSSYFTFPGAFNTTTGQITTASYRSNLKLTTVPLREITNTILFDRVDSIDQIGNLTVNDNFIGTKDKSIFQLSWLAQPNKSKIYVTLNGYELFESAYTLIYSNEQFGGYTKKYSYLKIFLDKIQLIGLNDIENYSLSVTYEKNIELLTAAERVKNFYSPTDGMITNDISLLMSGVSDPRKIIGGQYEGKGFSNINSGMIADSIINPSDSYYPSWNYGGLINALGINPSDLVIDGSFNFLSPEANQAPDEQVPGFSADSLGIDVFTKSPYQTPTIFNGSVNISPSNLDNLLTLSVMPPTTASIIVTFNNKLFEYQSLEKTWTTSTQFSIDWTNNKLLIPNQDKVGILAYTIIGVGDATLTGLGIIGFESLSVNVASTSTSTRLTSMINYRQLKSSYVTVDGAPITRLTATNSINDLFYYINTVSSRDTRAAVDIYNLSSGTHYIQSWFFDSYSPKFNQIQEQIIRIDDEPIFVNDENGFASSIAITNFPKILNSPNSQVVVELIPDAGLPVRLRPPYAVYYTVTTTDVTLASYPIVASTSSFVFDDLQSKNMKVYLDGHKLNFGVSQDFYVSNNAVILTTRPALVGYPPIIGSQLIIETFYYNDISNSQSINDGSVIYDYDFVLDTNNEAILLTPNYSTSTNSSIKITTFTIQDSLGIVTQRFVGNPDNRTYKLSYPVLNSNYLWVEINSTATGLLSLINNVDYQLLEDHLTVLISSEFFLTNNDSVFIMSFADPGKSGKNMGYRITKDFLGKTNFTRISSVDSTYLTQPLSAFDTEIYVADGSMLSAPNSEKNIPGVILVAGERIEFFKNVDNVLSQLRRGTGGTSPLTNLDAGTVVIDQGTEQIIEISPGTPYTDKILIQNTYTSANLENTYIINTTTITTWVNPITSSTVRCDGITLMTTKSSLPVDPYTGIQTYLGRTYSVSTASIHAKDQLEIYYGGQLLRKNQSFHHDTTIMYDGILLDQIKGTVPSASFLSSATIYLGDSYICEDTDEVWVCTENQYNLQSVPSFVYSGLKRYKPDFTINTGTQQIILNTQTVKIQTGTQLVVVMKQVGPSWNDVKSINSTTSLLDSTGTITKFLKLGNAVLPTHYFYGSASSIAKPQGGV